MDQIKTGRFIAEQRKALGMTQRQLAERLSVSDKTVSKWECGATMPDLALIVPLARLLQVSTDTLLGMSPPENDPRKQ